LEHWLGTRRLDPWNLERVQDGVRTYFDEGVAKIFFLEVNCHLCFKNTFVKADQPVHIGSDKGEVMDIVEQFHNQLLLMIEPMGGPYVPIRYSGSEEG
jgi:hypothetical protein